MRYSAIFCSSHLFCFYILFILFYFAWQDMSPEDIPIMLVGNKCDLRQDGLNCVPTTYGEKLAMVMTTKHPLNLTIFLRAF